MEKNFTDAKQIYPVAYCVFNSEQISLMRHVFEDVYLENQIPLSAQELRDTLALAILKAAKETTDEAALRTAAFKVMSGY